MTDIALQDKKEIEGLLQEFPIFQKFNNRLHTIAELIKDAKEEKDLVFMADSFETVIRLQDRLSAEMISYVSKVHEETFNGMAKNCREWKEIAEKLEAALKEEQQESSEVFDKMCFCMTVNPRETFEKFILKNVERKEKTESGDGWNNWQWRLHFPLMARLRMAWKLVFGRKDIQESST